MDADRGNFRYSFRGRTTVPNDNSSNIFRNNVYVSTSDKHRYSGEVKMARGRRTVSRMEKFVHQGFNTLIDIGHDELQSFQLDGGEVEAQVKRLSLIHI